MSSEAYVPLPVNPSQISQQPLMERERITSWEPNVLPQQIQHHLSLGVCTLSAPHQLTLVSHPWLQTHTTPDHLCASVCKGCPDLGAHRFQHLLLKAPQELPGSPSLLCVRLCTVCCRARLCSWLLPQLLLIGPPPHAWLPSAATMSLGGDAAGFPRDSQELVAISLLGQSPLLSGVCRLRRQSLGY